MYAMPLWWWDVVSRKVEDEEKGGYIWQSLRSGPEPP